LPQYYNDFYSRFSYHDTFHFLSYEDRIITLRDDYSFIVLSDIHISNIASADSFAELKNHIGDAQFIVVTGDITQTGTKEEIQLFIDAARTFGIPCYPVIGNHDIYTDRVTAWNELIGSTCYSIGSPESNITLYMKSRCLDALPFHGSLFLLQDLFDSPELLGGKGCVDKNGVIRGVAGPRQGAVNYILA
jgi:predicted phosphodiesterase